MARLSGLTRAIKASGARRERIAADAQISVSYLRMLERAQYMPSLEIARRLAAVLEMSVDELFPVGRS